MTAIIIVLAFMVLLGAFTLMYQIYQLTVLDAKCRGLKHPKFWGFFSLGGNNGSSGLILYLIGRRKYPISISVDESRIMTSRKKRAGVSLCFLAAGTVFLMIIVSLGGYF